MKKVGIVLDDWKLPIFERRLLEAGFSWIKAGALTQGTVVLTVDTPDVSALQGVVTAANAEAAQSGQPAPTRTLTDGSPVTPDHREINPSTGQQKGYVVLSAEERAKGFVRPVRRKYVHLKCGTVTTMAESIAETYARDPGFYNGTFCCHCREHFPLAEFRWNGTDEVVGS
jgi:hypothetical protein